MNAFYILLQSILQLFSFKLTDFLHIFTLQYVKNIPPKLHHVYLGNGFPAIFQNHWHGVKDQVKF